MLHGGKSMPVHLKRNSAKLGLTKPETCVVHMVHFCSRVVSHSIWWMRIYHPQMDSPVLLLRFHTKNGTSVPKDWMVGCRAEES